MRSSIRDPSQPGQWANSVISTQTGWITQGGGGVADNYLVLKLRRYYGAKTAGDRSGLRSAQWEGVSTAPGDLEVAANLSAAIAQKNLPLRAEWLLACTLAALSPTHGFFLECQLNTVAELWLVCCLELGFHFRDCRYFRVGSMLCTATGATAQQYAEKGVVMALGESVSANGHGTAALKGSHMPRLRM